jgi:peptidylprolyl isomerase
MRNTLIFSCFLVLFSCSQKSEEEKPAIKWNQEKSVHLNKELAIEEELQIKMFIERYRQWKFETTGTGLRICFLEKGTGELAAVGDVVQVEAKYTLLDGTLCHQTEADEIEEFTVDKSDIESGVQEAIKKMHVGDKVKLIIPFRLAQGLVGNLQEIPPLATLVVDLNLIGN